MSLDENAFDTKKKQIAIFFVCVLFFWFQGLTLDAHYIHLMCSPSRTQIITGRYAMHQGFGKMLPWDYTEIGGIPLGQATVANWLKDMGGYKTYGIGKWHMGYSYEGQTPLYRGFDHFYGFYQGAIHYDTKNYVDIKYGNSIGHHPDFWEDSLIANDVIYDQNQTNTLYYYNDKMIEYINDAANSDTKDPFYMYLALQTIHGPLEEIDEKTDACLQMLGPDDITRRVLSFFSFFLFFIF